MQPIYVCMFVVIGVFHSVTFVNTFVICRAITATVSELQNRENKAYLCSTLSSIFVPIVILHDNGSTSTQLHCLRNSENYFARVETIST